MRILVTGAAGFIGSALARSLARRGDEVVGIDNINAYYDPRLKYARLRHFYGIEASPQWPRIVEQPATGSPAAPVVVPDMPYGQMLQSPQLPNLRFMRLDITDAAGLDALFADFRPQRVMNLAAQAGVRYSISNPMAYVETNVVGFTNLLECCRKYPVEHLVYASSSSVYGGNEKVPFSEADHVDSPVSLYAATKKSNELFAHTYTHLYGIHITGLRYFTVYGPWGRPDMAPCLFADAILDDRPIKVFNNGNLSRDFTYIDDIVEGTIRIIDHLPWGEGATPVSPIFNIGCGHPEQLMDFIALLEAALGRTARRQLLPMQQGDVYRTWADTTRLREAVGYTPAVSLAEGIPRFVQWFTDYRKSNL